MIGNKCVKISIIVAVYNGAETLQRCIDSIANQRYLNLELIIIDGASTDGTVDIIKMNSEHITYWVSEPDKGIGDAWNKALKVLKGDWFLILGADDYLADQFVIESFVVRLDGVDINNHLVLYGEVNRVNMGGVIIEANDGGEWSIDRFLSRPMYVCHQSIFCHSSLIKKIGSFDESLRTSMDYDYLLRSTKLTTPCYLKGLLVSNFTLGGVSGSTADILTMYREIMAVKVKNGYQAVQGYFYFMLMKVAVKYLLERVFGSRVRRGLVNCYRMITGRSASHER